MASSLTTSTSIATYRTSARWLGATFTFIGLALAVLTAQGLVDVAHDRVGRGLALLSAAIVARWIVASVSEEWSSHSSLVIRQQWRSELVAHLQQPRREGERSRGDLALAIEHASNAPTLTLLSVSARSAPVGLVVIWWSAGWLSTLIVVGLLAVAVPLYQRAGRRSAALESDYRARRAVLESRQLELLHHGPELRALGAVAYGANEIAAISDAEHATALRAIRAALGSSLVTEFLSGVSVGLVAMVVGFALLGGRLSLIRGLVAVLVTSELFGAVRRFGAEFHRRDDAATSLALLTSITRPIVATTTTYLVAANELVTEASDAPLTLHVNASSRILITGASGSGKTTLLQTLLGWRHARAGHVERTDALVGYVSVESPLISGSLWDNLTLGADVEPEVVLQLMGALGLEGSRFNDLGAPLLSDGHGLSSGERVRLVLARVLLVQPALVMLDDIAGVLDVASRTRVARVLATYPRLAIIEVTVDTPILSDPSQRFELCS